MTPLKQKTKVTDQDALTPTVPLSPRDIDRNSKKKRWPIGAPHICDVEMSQVETLCSELGLARGTRPWMLAGKGGVGKTLTAYDLAIAHAGELGSALGGALTLASGGPVVVCAYEGYRMSKPRLEAIAQARGIAVTRDLPLRLVRDRGAGPHAVEHMRAWSKCLTNRTLVIVDSMRAMNVEADEYHPSYATPLQVMERLASDTGATFVVLAHEGKTPGLPRGTTALVDKAELVSSLAVKGSIRTLSCAKSNGRPHDDIRFKINFDGDHLVGFESVGTPADITEPAPHQSGDHQRDRVLTALRKLKGSPLSQRKLGAELKMSNATVGIHLSALASAGQAVRTAKGWTTTFEGADE